MTIRALIFIIGCGAAIGLFISLVLVRARRPRLTKNAVTPKWVNEHAYDRDPGPDDQDPRR
jgi:hypothetical protein